MLLLKNKIVLVTRPKKQASEFISKLKQLGASPIEFPLIHLQAINQLELKASFDHQKFDWIIFTSANAVHVFFETIPPQSIQSKIAVVGTKTNKTLTFYGLKSDFIPSQFTAKVLAEELPALANETILLPQSAISKNDIATQLTKRKITVFPIKIYQNSPITYKKEELNAFFDQKTDFITFTSGSTVEAFKKLNVNLKNVQIICIGPETAKVAKENNLPVSSIAHPHTIEGMIDAMVELSLP